MASISSRDLVPRDHVPAVSDKTVRALVKHEDKRRLQTAIRVVDREYDRIDHANFTETVLGAAERDVERVAEFSGAVRDIVAGDELTATLVAPIMNTAVAAVQTHYRGTFGNS